MLKKEFKAGLMTVKVYDTRKNMGLEAGKEAAQYLRDLLARKEEINVVFAAAPSQNEFLATLAEESGIDWSRVNALHMDEYVGLPADHPAGFGNFLKRAIWDKINCKSVTLIGCEKTAEQAVADYDKVLRGRKIDIVFFGIGENGHIAFNDPGEADFNDPALIKKVKLDEVCRMQQVHDGCFASIDEVPQYALSLTVPELMSCDKAFVVVPAPAKANAVKATIEHEISDQVPSTILRQHPDATLYVDSDSGKYIL